MSRLRSDELLTVHPPTRLTGGLQVRFPDAILLGRCALLRVGLPIAVAALLVWPSSTSRW
jgi:hypothetical protein